VASAAPPFRSPNFSALASSPLPAPTEKLQKAKQLGADYLINHKKQKIRDEVRRLTNKRGVDVVFEHVGTSTWDDSLASLAAGGRLVTCGPPRATTPRSTPLSLHPATLLLGSYMGTNPNCKR